MGDGKKDKKTRLKGMAWEGFWWLRRVLSGGIRVGLVLGRLSGDRRATSTHDRFDGNAQVGRYCGWTCGGRIAGLEAGGEAGGRGWDWGAG